MGALIFPYRIFSGKLKMSLTAVSVKSLREGLGEEVSLTGEEWNHAQRSLLLWKRDDIEWNTAHFEIEGVACFRAVDADQADLAAGFDDDVFVAHWRSLDVEQIISGTPDNRTSSVRSARCA